MEQKLLLNNWVDRILKGKVDRGKTYKLALAAVIFMNIGKNRNGKEVDRISTEQISEEVADIYWNMESYFGLKQYSAGKLDSGIFEFIENKTVELGKKITFKKLKVEFPNIHNELIKITKKIIDEHPIYHLAKKISGHKVKGLMNFKTELYTVVKTKGNSSLTELIFNKEQVEVINSHRDVLKMSVNYRWINLLEKNNIDIKISTKLEKLTSFKTTKRSNLKKYKEVLIRYYTSNKKQIKCFYTNKIVELNDIDIDHFVPWSIYPVDKLENLVISSSSANRSLSDNIEKKASRIKKLNNRNKKLSKFLDKLDKNQFNHFDQKIWENELKKIFILKGIDINV